jgi:transcriptional antiterminator NusG
VALRWYIVHAYSNFEHKVKASLEERIALLGLEEKFGEILVPTEEVVEMKEGQKRRSERKFFPGYVLVQMEMDDETWHLVKEVPKVLGFIGGSSDRPAPITEKEADQILNRVKETLAAWSSRCTTKRIVCRLQYRFWVVLPRSNWTSGKSRRDRNCSKAS